MQGAQGHREQCEGPHKPRLVREPDYVLKVGWQSEGRGLVWGRRASAATDSARRCTCCSLLPLSNQPDMFSHTIHTFPLCASNFPPQYHRFLCDIGDTDNARALFDRAFSEPDNLRSALLWQRYVQFEYELGNVAAAWQVGAGWCARGRCALGSSRLAAAAAAGGAGGAVMSVGFGHQAKRSR